MSGSAAEQTCRVTAAAVFVGSVGVIGDGPVWSWPRSRIGPTSEQSIRPTAAKSRRNRESLGRARRDARGIHQVQVDTGGWRLSRCCSPPRVETGTGTSGAATIKNQNGVTKPIASVVVYSVTSTATDPVNTCFDNSTGPDLFYAGPINTLHNATSHLSFGGTCAGPVDVAVTIVQASDQAGAQVLCGSLTGLPAVTSTLQFLGYDAAPADYWLCAL